MRRSPIGRYYAQPRTACKWTNYSRLRNAYTRARDFLRNVISRSHIPGALRNNIPPDGRRDVKTADLDLRRGERAFDHPRPVVLLGTAKARSFPAARQPAVPFASRL